MQQALYQLFDQQGLMDERSAQSLAGALSSNSLQGFDYLKFKQSYQQLLAMGMVEEMAVRSAFTTAATMGLTKEKLLQTAEHYQNVLHREEKQFDAALKKQLHQKVDSRRDEREFLEAKINEYQKKIEDLQKQIVEFRNQMENAESEIAESKEKIEQTKERFNHAYQHFLDSISHDLELIKKYL